MPLKLLLKDIPYEVGKDNIAYYDAYLTGAKAQLKKVVEWGNELCGKHIVFDDELGQVTPLHIARCSCAECWETLLDEVKDATE